MSAAQVSHSVDGRIRHTTSHRFTEQPSLERSSDPPQREGVRVSLRRVGGGRKPDSERVG